MADLDGIRGRLHDALRALEAAAAIMDPAHIDERDRDAVAQARTLIGEASDRLLRQTFAEGVTRPVRVRSPRKLRRDVPPAGP